MSAQPVSYHRPLPLSASQLEAMCSASVYRHAARYAKSAHMVDRMRVGESLSARFHGTRGIYAARIDLSDREFRYECTCPLASPSRPCKHVVALGLAWLEQPDSFRDLDIVLANLAYLSKAELLTLLRRAATRLPEMIPLLERGRAAGG